MIEPHPDWRRVAAGKSSIAPDACGARVLASFLAVFVIFAAAARDGAWIDERAVTTGQTGKGDTPDPEPEPTPEPTPEPDGDSSAS